MCLGVDEGLVELLAVLEFNLAFSNSQVGTNIGATMLNSSCEPTVGTGAKTCDGGEDGQLVSLRGARQERKMCSNSRCCVANGKGHHAVLCQWCIHLKVNTIKQGCDKFLKLGVPNKIGRYWASIRSRGALGADGQHD